MSFLVGANWRDFFDVVIVQARKPKFFTDESRPIRLFDERTQSHLWDRVFKLEKGKIYYEVRVSHSHLVSNQPCCLMFFTGFGETASRAEGLAWSLCALFRRSSVQRPSRCYSEAQLEDRSHY